MVKIEDRVKFRVMVRVRVKFSVSYIMTIWRWEELSRCDKFPTTPARIFKNDAPIASSFCHSGGAHCRNLNASSAPKPKLICG